MIGSSRMFFRTAAAFLLGGAGLAAQPMVCDGRNHLNNATTGSWGLPAVRTLGVRYTPASTLIVERLEWFFVPSPLTPVSGGTVSVVLEDPATGQPSTNPAQVVAQVQWNGTQVLPAWDGGTFSSPALLQGGTNFWLTTTASPVTGHQAPAYDDTGPDPTTYAIETGGTWFFSSTPHRFKVRLLATNCGGLPTPEYQINQPGASADINGVQGTASLPATVTLGVGQIGAINLSSTSTGAPWDVAFGLAPLVPASGGGLPLAGGQIINVDLTDPTLSFLYSPPFNGPPFFNVVLIASPGMPVAVSFQMAILDPMSPTGLWLSQPNRLIVQ